MSVPAADLRALHSREGSLDSKLLAASRLLSTLQLHQDGGVADGARAPPLPPLVRFHYSKTVLDWTLTAVVKGSAGQKKATSGGNAARGIREAEARLRPDCWRVATVLLASQSVPATYQLPAALVPTVAALLSQLSLDLPENDQGSLLLQQLGELLRLLSSKFGASSRPSLEHAVGLAEAALAGWQSAEAGPQDTDAGGTEQAARAWVAVTQGAVAMLQAAVAAHPVPRKVWEGVLPRLLVPLAVVGFHPAAPVPAGGAAQTLGTLAAQSQALLEAVIFHPAHIPGMSASQRQHAVAAFAASPAEAAPDSGKGVDGHGAGTVPGRTHRPYAALLFEQLAARLDAKRPQQLVGKQQQEQQPRKRARQEEQKEAPLVQEAAGSAPDAVPCLLRMLPWVLERYCGALAKFRRATEAEAALLTQGGSSRKRGPGEEGSEEGAAAGAGASSTAGGAGTAGTLPAAADFHMFAALLDLLLGRAGRLGSGLAAEAEPAAGLGNTVRAIARLTGPLKSHKVYRPTQDPQGIHRAVLQRLTDAMLAVAQRAKHAQQAPRLGPSAAADVEGAVLQVLQGVLAVEHRPIQGHLPAIWALLLSPAAPAASADGPAAAPAKDAAVDAGTLLSASGAAWQSAGAPQGVAVEVACGLVGAYAELRQLPTLLDSLAEALLGQSAPVEDSGSEKASSRSGSKHKAGAPSPAAAGGASAAAAVVGSGAFQVWLSEAVEGLPSGQAAGLVQWMVGWAGRLQHAGSNDAMLPVFMEVCTCCLASLVVDLTTAPAVAQAAEALIASLALSLPRLLSALEGLQPQEAPGGTLLPCLLRLYALALAVHARCAAQHPQVVPLPGQQAKLRTEDLVRVGPLSPCLVGGYFAALGGRQGVQNGTPAVAFASAPLPGPSSAAAALPGLLAVLRLLLPQEGRLGSPKRKSRGEGSGASLDGPGVPASGAQCQLALVAVQAAVQRLGVLHRRCQYLQHLCPAALTVQKDGQGELPDLQMPGSESAAAAEGGDVEMADAPSAAALRPCSQASEPDVPSWVQGQVLAQQQAAEGELRGLAEWLCQTLAASLAAARTSRDSSSCSGDGGSEEQAEQCGGLAVEFGAATLEALLPAAEQLVTWAPADSLKPVLEASAVEEVVQEACLQLGLLPLTHTQRRQQRALEASALRLWRACALPEVQQAREPLLGATFSQLYLAIRAIANCLPQNAPLTLPSPAAKKTKTGKAVEVARSPAAAASTEAGTAGQLAAQLAGHVKRLSRGKAIKAPAWQANVAACLQSIASQAACLPPAAAASEAALGDGGSGSGGEPAGTASVGRSAKKERKRKHQPADDPGDAGAGKPETVCQALDALSRLLKLVKSLSLEHQDALGHQQAASLAQAALAATLAAALAGLSSVDAITDQAPLDRQRLVQSTLTTLSLGLNVLQTATANTWLAPRLPASCQHGEHPPAPALLVAPDWPALLGALCSAAAALVQAQGQLARGTGGASSGVAGSTARDCSRGLQPAGEVWTLCRDLMACWVAAALLAPAAPSQAPTPEGGLEPRPSWLEDIVRQLSLLQQACAQPQQGSQEAQPRPQLQGTGLGSRWAAAMGAAQLGEACLAACHGSLLAVQAAEEMVEAAGKGPAKPRTSSSAADVACGPGAALLALRAAGFERGPYHSGRGGYERLEQVLAQSIAVQQQQAQGRQEELQLNSALLTAVVRHLQPAVVGAALNAGTLLLGKGAGDSPSSGRAAAWLLQECLASLYGGLASTLCMLCLPHPAADALHAPRQAGQQPEPEPDPSGVAASLGVLLQQAAGLLLREPSAPAGNGSLSRGLDFQGPQQLHTLSGDASCSCLSLRLLGFVGAACELTHHMRPAPSASHFASLLALLLCLLRALSPAADTLLGAAPALDPTRHTLPFTAIFPAASLCQPPAPGGLCSTRAQCCGPAAGQLRRAALGALRSLIAGCSSRQLSQLLRLVERALPAAAGAAASDGREGQEASAAAQHAAPWAVVGSGAGALALAELALMVLEASTGGRAGHVMGQHGERLAGVLSRCVAALVATPSALAGAGRGAAAAPAGEGGGGVKPGTQGGHAGWGRALLTELAKAILEAEGAIPQGSQVMQEMLEQKQAQVCVVWWGASAGPLPGGFCLGSRLRQADVAATCTALRALESLAARPQIFGLSAHAVSTMVHSVAGTWAACRAWAAGGAPGGLYCSEASPRSPCWDVSVREGAAMFGGSCALLLAVLRHRQKEIGRCLPLMLLACRALLVWLVGAELAAKLASGHPGDVPAWRVKCAGALARVLEEVAALKATTSRYCPHLLADYLILAASPLTPKARTLLGLLSSGAEHDPGTFPGPTAAHAGFGAAVEGDPLAGGAVCAETAAALRQGACAVYGACSSSEIQYLYASLGQKGGAVWRSSLAALKTHYELHYKYTGKV
ncbi:hypothetical protein N2152v2_006254 [Parachlorella kessleri]